MTTPPVVLTIAGTDSGGAAGVAADLTTFAALGAHGACAVTAVTAQDTTGVHRVIALAPEDVQAQVDAVLQDLPLAAVKTGMLGSAAVAEVPAGLPSDVPLVVDPVLVATSGAGLGNHEVADSYRRRLLPMATVITPNLDEAATLAGATVDDPPEDIARALHALGPAVLLTGGDPTTGVCRDVLVDATGTHLLKHPTVPTDNDHGTGCTFSAALAVGLARGSDLRSACLAAQSFVADALQTSRTWRLGRGRGPVAHTFAQPSKEA